VKATASRAWLARFPRPLALLLGVGALLSVAWTFTLAPFQGPDEPAHFDYAQHLAETGHRPSPSIGTHPDSDEAANALYFLNLDQLAGVADARPAWTHLEERRFAQIDAQLGRAGRRNGSGPNAVGGNPPLYYAYEVAPYWLGSLLGSLWDRLVVMRLAGGLLLLITIACAWLAASELFALTWPRVLATGCVALLPQLTALSGSINADNLLIAEWSAFTFLALRTVRRGPSVKRVLGLCLLAAASGLTHGRGVAIVPALLVVLVMAALRSRHGLGQVLKVLVPGAALLVAAALVYWLVLAPSTGAYGGQLTLGHGAVSLKGLLSNTWQFYLPKLPFMGPRIGGDAYGYRQMFIESFFGRFSDLEVAFPPLVYTLVQAACAVGLAGLVVAVWGRWAEIRPRWRELVALLGIVLSMIGLLHLASYRSLADGTGTLITGRYLLPLVVVFGLAVAFVISSLRPRAGAVAGAIALSGLLALNLAGLMLTFTRFYG
jgi:hypothetical protein